MFGFSNFLIMVRVIILLCLLNFFKFFQDVGARGVDFGHKSGLYSIEVIVGDASISNSFKWYVGDIQLKFSSQPKGKT